MNKKKIIGQYAEAYALAYLEQRNLVLVAKNFHSRWGEIDLIMLDGDQLCFIEVRARANSSYTTAAESVDCKKQRKIIQTAQYFLQQQSNDESYYCRFDVIALEYENSADFLNTAHDYSQQKTFNIQWIMNAYTM